ncbi:hypothetical protein Cch01nite_26580 [Cellulomonas chitinilytica]|uniref:Uncharacterized protein n=2 Tax=Cellulomonas chitinilytica TaxID=398759 RepID=A0A919P5W6_9CELL|nr:hypothetical protein Cch01nite_26580 [Cellulomonas chitinilytica]
MVVARWSRCGVRRGAHSPAPPSVAHRSGTSGRRLVDGLPTVSAMPRTSPLLACALDDVEAARHAIAVAQQVPWVSVAADRYRAALDDAAASTTAVRARVERATVPVAALDLVVGGGPVPGTWTW